MKSSTTKSSPAPASPPPATRTAQLPWSAVVTTAALTTIVIFLNVLGVRHYKRWDATADKRYSLSPATVTTLRGVTAPLDLWVLMSNGDPLRESVRQILVAYNAETPHLRVHYIDPDRDPAAYLDVKTKFRMEAGRSGGTGVATGSGASADAVIIAAQGDKHWFIAQSDLVTIENPEDPRAKPREERAITGAIRSLVAGEKTQLCFTAGFGELDTEDASDQGLAFLVDLLARDNYAARTVDASLPAAVAPYKDCAAVIVAGPRAPWSRDAAEKLKSYLLGGGSALLAVSPVNADTDTGMTVSGLAGALTPFGVQFEEDLVFETDARIVFPGSRGIRFGVAAKPHAVTQGLVEGEQGGHAPRIIMHFTRSLTTTAADGAPVPSPLLITSVGAYGVRNISGAKDWEGAPQKKPGDPQGPLVVAMASERAKLAATAAHGPRMVVVGSGAAMIRTNWKLDSDGRGVALLIENSIAWLTAKPQVLDVPEKQSIVAGLRVTEADKQSVFQYAVVLMPLAWCALGVALYFMRKRNEGAPWQVRPR
jgi:ABC-2 type transport system permease protein